MSRTPTTTVGFVTDANIFDQRPAISDADAMREEAERRLAAEHADASLRIEGLEGIDDYEAKLREDWIKGRITSDERAALLKAHYHPDV